MGLIPQLNAKKIPVEAMEGSAADIPSKPVGMPALGTSSGSVVTASSDLINGVGLSSSGEQSRQSDPMNNGVGVQEGQSGWKLRGRKILQEQEAVQPQSQALTTQSLAAILDLLAHLDTASYQRYDQAPDVDSNRDNVAAGRPSFSLSVHGGMASPANSGSDRQRVGPIQPSWDRGAPQSDPAAANSNSNPVTISTSSQSTGISNNRPEGRPALNAMLEQLWGGRRSYSLGSDCCSCSP